MGHIIVSQLMKYLQSINKINDDSEFWVWEHHYCESQLFMTVLIYIAKAINNKLQVDLAVATRFL